MPMNKEIFAQTDRLVLRKFNLCGILQDEKKQCTPMRAPFRTVKRRGFA
jgi:hypothetical protein